MVCLIQSIVAYLDASMLKVFNNKAAAGTSFDSIGMAQLLVDL